jgi:hypothetical protein
MVKFIKGLQFLFNILVIVFYVRLLDIFSEHVVYLSMNTADDYDSRLLGLMVAVVGLTLGLMVSVFLYQLVLKANNEVGKRLKNKRKK